MWLKKNLERKIYFTLLNVCASSTVLLTACATDLQPGAEKVRPVSADQKAACESLGIVVADQQLGPYKTQNSMNKAINDVVRRGGNAIYIMANAPSGIDGVSVTAEALKCK